MIQCEANFILTYKTEIVNENMKLASCYNWVASAAHSQSVKLTIPAPKEKTPTKTNVLFTLYFCGSFFLQKINSP